MAGIIAVCGKICSGKTYYADRIRGKENAVILSCDELTKALFDNDLGDSHDAMAARIQSYLMKKAAELVRVGCTVILDWGFWSRNDRLRLTEFCRARGIACEWHYVDVDDRTWRQNVEERNARVLKDPDSPDYYLDEGLMRKMLSRWEAPSAAETDVRYVPKRQ